MTLLINIDCQNSCFLNKSTIDLFYKHLNIPELSIKYRNIKPLRVNQRLWYFKYSISMESRCVMRIAKCQIRIVELTNAILPCELLLDRHDFTKWKMRIAYNQLRTAMLFQFVLKSTQQSHFLPILVNLYTWLFLGGQILSILFM